MKVYLMHKKGIPDRLTNVLDLLYACKVVDCIEIVTSESSDVVFADEAERSLLLPYDFPNKKLSLQEKSIFHKQYKAFQKMMLFSIAQGLIALLRRLTLFLLIGILCFLELDVTYQYQEVDLFITIID